MTDQKVSYRYVIYVISLYYAEKIDNFCFCFIRANGSGAIFWSVHTLRSSNFI